MCLDVCGQSIEQTLNDFLHEAKKEKAVPDDAILTLNSEPSSLGIHRLYLSISSNHTICNKAYLSKAKHIIEDLGFEVVAPDKINPAKKNYPYFIFINMITMCCIMALYFLFNPSLGLNLLLSAVTFLSSGLTLRDYLTHFFNNLRQKRFSQMSGFISLGWLMALFHAIYHILMMPSMLSMAMVFMNFIMPLILVTTVHIMDAVKHFILGKSKTLALKGLSNLFPHMSKDYECYLLSNEYMNFLEQQIEEFKKKKEFTPLEAEIVNKLQGASHSKIDRTRLGKGMIISVKEGAYFPVDCTLIKGQTHINSALLTGEPYQKVQFLEKIPAGAMNLGEEVFVYTLSSPYHSAINKLLFRSNRQILRKPNQEKGSAFANSYTLLIISALVTAVIAPLLFGVLTFPLFLENITALLFSICPCTILFAMNYQDCCILMKHIKIILA